MANIQMQYYNGSSYEVCYPQVSMTNVTGKLPLANGGTNYDMSSIPDFAIIRNSGPNYNYLYYVPTKSGALYATAENGQPSFGTLPVALGGTGATSLSNISLTSLGGTLSVAKGGTGKTSFTTNRLIYPSASTTLSQLAFPTENSSILMQNKTGAPYWSNINNVMSNFGGLQVYTLLNSTNNINTSCSTTSTNFYTKKITVTQEVVDIFKRTIFIVCAFTPNLTFTKTDTLGTTAYMLVVMLSGLNIYYNKIIGTNNSSTNGDTVTFTDSYAGMIQATSYGAMNGGTGGYTENTVANRSFGKYTVGDTITIALKSGSVTGQSIFSVSGSATFKIFCFYV